MTKPDYIEALEFALGVEAVLGHYHDSAEQFFEDGHSWGLLSRCNDGKKSWLINGEPVSFETHRDKAELMLRLMEAMREKFPTGGLTWTDGGPRNFSVYGPSLRYGYEVQRASTFPEAVLKAVLAVKESE